MNIKYKLAELYQYVGLKFINFMANSKHCQIYKTVSYGPQSRQKFDLYRVDNDVCRPTVIFFYGGNWRAGERADYRFVADTLMKNGNNVIVADYRLYPLVRFNEILDDAKQVVTWAAQHLPKESPVFILGHSAGAQLGALLCLDESILEASVRSRIKGFIGLAGPYDFYPYTEADHWDLFSPRDNYAQSQAVNFINSDAPPMYLLHGETDTRVRRGNSKSLLQKMIAAGGQARREVYSSMGHVDIILSFTKIHRSQSQVVKDIVAFIQSPLVFQNNESTKNYSEQKTLAR